MSEEGGVSWPIVLADAAATLVVVIGFVWCLRRFLAAPTGDERHRWRTWTLVSGTALLLWTVHMTWAIIDWGSHPLNR